VPLLPLRHVSLIWDYIAEHERVTDLGGDAVRAIDEGDPEKAGAEMISD
jgi:hypothetical protein